MTLTMQAIETVKTRRAAGEKLSVIAKEYGMPWQRLYEAIGARGQRRPAITLTPTGAGPLTERYRPRRLTQLLGQSKVRSVLERFAAHPQPQAFLFAGETGTGKTSAALALAAELGCDVARQEYGGVHQIASGEQNAEAVKSTYELLCRTPFCGSGWKVVIVNEADRISAAAETIWLDRLEQLPPRSVVIFTTNHPEKLSQRLRDRCMELRFASDAADLDMDARELAAAIWQAEAGQPAPAEQVEYVLSRAVVDGQLSFRRLVSAVQTTILGAN